MSSNQLTKWLTSMEGEIQAYDDNFRRLTIRRIKEMVEHWNSKLANIHAWIALQNEPADAHYHRLVGIERRIKSLELRTQIERPGLFGGVKRIFDRIGRGFAWIFGLWRRPALTTTKRLQISYHQSEIDE
jgi:hypothetical protein